MHLIGNVVAWGDDNPKWESNESVELLDEHYYRNPAWFAENFNKYDNYDRKGSEIYVWATTPARRFMLWDSTSSVARK